VVREAVGFVLARLDGRLAAGAAAREPELEASVA
jgi:hypothetical protein